MSESRPIGDRSHIVSHRQIIGYFAVVLGVLVLAACGTPRQAATGSVHPAGWGGTPKGLRSLPTVARGVPSAEMWDTVTLETVPAHPFALAGYTSGFWPTYLPLRRSYPSAHVISIAVTTSYHADCLDVEPGDASPSEAGPWARTNIAAGFSHPCLYSDLSEMPAVRASLSAAGLQRSQYALWLAWYRFVPGLVYGYDAVQWTDHAYGRNLDESTVSLAFLTIAQPPYVPPTPTPKPKPVNKHPELVAALRRRDHLRALLTKRRCRVIHGRRAYHACSTWAREGRAANRTIARLRAEGVH
jgi:hypothetical protein